MKTLHEITQSIKSSFSDNVESVDRLMSFDKVVLDFTRDSLCRLDKNLKELGITNPSMSVDQTIKQIETIRQNSSLKSQYDEIYNQGVVLLVSYFGSALQDLFEKCVAVCLSGECLSKLLDEQLQLTIRDIKNKGFDLKDCIGEFLITSQNISFQDMQSIRRAFVGYLNVKMEIIVY
jgi:hypothetical protein